MHADVRFPRLLALLALAVNLAHAFYIPGWSIKSYADGEAIPLFVNKVYSDKTQLQYAYAELPFVCPPTGRRSPGASGATLSLNLGEILRGDRITLSDYELVMGVDEEARYLCSVKVDRRGVERAKEIVKDGYVAEWIVDNLPGATSFVTTDKSRKYYAAGFKMGYEDFDPATGKPHYYVNNHVTLVIRYRTAPGRDGERGKKVIVGFEVYTKSIEAGNRDKQGLPKDLHNVEKGLELHIQPNNTDLHSRYADSSYIPAEEDIDDDATLTIPYTYSVYFREDDKLEWQNRWDMYFVNQEDSSKIHWIAIINSLLISAILTAAVAVIFTRTVRGDIKGSSDIEKPKMPRSKPRSPPRKSAEKGGLLGPIDDDDGDADISSDEEPLEDITGWKLLHGDVFRAPAYGGLLAPLVGSGSQLVFMATGLLILSALGVLNPSFRGGFISVGIALFIIAGIFSGYFSARVYKTFGGQRWQKNVIVTGTLIPGLLFATIFILNLFVWAQASSTAIPFGTLVALLVLWLLVQLPLVYVGSWYGFEKVGAWSHPVKTNAIPRQVPPQAWYMKNLQFVLLAGLLPFAVIFIELLFVFKSLWQDKSGYYYVYGFLAAVCLILFITVVEVTIIATYNQLCSEVRSPRLIAPNMLTCHRTTTGGGNPSSSVVALPSGFSWPARGTTSSSSISRVSYPACSFSPTASSLVSCTACLLARLAFWQRTHSCAGSTELLRRTDYFPISKRIPSMIAMNLFSLPFVKSLLCAFFHFLFLFHFLGLKCHRTL